MTSLGLGFPEGGFKERQVYPAFFFFLARMKGTGNRQQGKELMWTGTIELCLVEARSPALRATRVTCSKASAMVYIDSRCNIDRV